MQNEKICYNKYVMYMKKIIIILIFIFIGFFVFTKLDKINNSLLEDYEPKFVINELYNSKEINYRYLLDDKEKKIYEDFLNAIVNFKYEITIDLSYKNHNIDYSYVDDVMKISDAIIMDHPELIQYAYPTIYTENDNGKIHVKIIYALSEKEYGEYVKIIANELENINKNIDGYSEYDKVKYIYEYLAKKNIYGDPNNPKTQSAYTAFVEDINPVCSGYARASQLLFGKVGVNSLLVVGELRDTWLKGDSHAWNIVKIGNYYYNYDVTQSSSFKSYSKNISYIGLFSMKKSSFVPRYKEVTPYIKRKNIDYYKKNNLYYDFNMNNIDKLKKIIDNTDNEYVEIKMTNITGFKLSFNNIKNDLGISTYSVIDDIIVLKKV